MWWFEKQHQNKLIADLTDKEHHFFSTEWQNSPKSKFNMYMSLLHTHFNWRPHTWISFAFYLGTGILVFQTPCEKKEGRIEQLLVLTLFQTRVHSKSIHSPAHTHTVHAFIQSRDPRVSCFPWLLRKSIAQFLGFHVFLKAFIAY